MPNRKMANGSSRLAIQRPVRTACELLVRFLGFIISGLSRCWLRWSMWIAAWPAWSLNGGL
jgi:hypothetical protein